MHFNYSKTQLLPNRGNNVKHLSDTLPHARVLDANHMLYSRCGRGSCKCVVRGVLAIVLTGCTVIAASRIQIADTMSSLLLFIVLAVVCRYTAAQGGCFPSPSSSLVTGVDKTGVIPDIRASPGGTVQYSTYSKCFLLFQSCGH